MNGEKSKKNGAGTSKKRTARRRGLIDKKSIFEQKRGPSNSVIDEDMHKQISIERKKTKRKLFTLFDGQARKTTDHASRNNKRPDRMVQLGMVSAAQESRKKLLQKMDNEVKQREKKGGITAKREFLQSLQTEINVLTEQRQQEVIKGAYVKDIKIHIVFINAVKTFKTDIIHREMDEDDKNIDIDWETHDDDEIDKEIVR
eukprot:UN25664